uniref:Cytochrome c peroxidase, mitochondrial n=1 Tax=Phaeomonas parva TaxID=124430 RepID=A0A7S1XUV8_9STRA|mmetsp:Transcript_35258/g.111015  ORF Transcript_35258/g.111015 Transcript_35258/m.111015 type:complete len:327 (+) Transcript_35258:109-1089(+)|eukprot:CAMPEP_0118853738 /NCGR_PEP_ID=MMETSP1163-20130328/2213_1 /TAXON_ID=124430 /ORGANISM="Phaeomonas parva, Strain CCMP2877" /LENGTH=326 /DNA_ID=CAMNT_0006786341 /DNA_START=464 /DNA_END=1444 /DNA_ORIENTATION=-
MFRSVRTLASRTPVFAAGSSLALGAVMATCGDEASPAAVKDDIKAIIEADEAKRGDGTSLAGTFVRLAWHASGTYSVKDKTGGSNGATMRFEPESAWGANAGLGVARDALEPLKAKYPSMSYADLWTLSGVASVEYMGGPTTPWRAGRTDSGAPTTVPDGRLPNADMGQPGKTIAHIRDIFGRMGFSDREMVALIGAHAVGRCHTDASGYWGPWTFAETTFSNEYFRLLIEEKWTIKTTHNGKAWNGPEQFEDPTGKLMMLPSDYAFVQDAAFRKWVEAYAADEELFFKDFAAAFGKLMELGVPFPGAGGGGLASILSFLKSLIGL